MRATLIFPPAALILLSVHDTAAAASVSRGFPALAGRVVDDAQILTPEQERALSVTAQQVTRVGGWSLAISGLIYAALWAFAPFQTAVVGGCAAIIIGMAVTFGYCIRLRSKTKTT